MGMEKESMSKDYLDIILESVQIRSFFWSVFSCIRTVYMKTRTRKNSAFEQFSRSVWTEYIQNFDRKVLITRIKLRIDFLVIHLSQHFGIYPDD